MPAYSNDNCGVRMPKNGCLATVAQVRALPLYHRETIPAEYMDAMGHMNVRWYMALYDQATWAFFDAIGMSADYRRKYDAGAFALRHFLNYFSEVRLGHIVALHTRVLGRSDKRFHFMHFMVDETTGSLASVFESLGTHADLKQRKSAPFPAFIADALDAELERDQKLDWDAPVCGILKP